MSQEEIEKAANTDEQVLVNSVAHRAILAGSMTGQSGTSFTRALDEPTFKIILKQINFLRIC